MSNPAPPQKPPEKSHMYLLMLFALAVIVIALGFTYGWFDFNKNAEGKRELKAHPENVQKSMDATKAWFKDVWAKSKTTFSSAKEKLSTVKNADSEKLQKDIDEVNKTISALEAEGKDVDDATKAKLKTVEDRLNKFLEEHKTPEAPKAPEKPKS